MSDHTPANLVRILAPLWETVPETRTDYNDSGISDMLCVKEWNRHIGLHWCLEGRDGSSVFISDGMARDIILARLQGAIEKRALSTDNSLSIYRTVDGHGLTSTMFSAHDTIQRTSVHPDPIIARAQLLAKIVGVELGDADA